jgi:hypothetical protein
MTAERASRLTALGFAWEGTMAHRNDAVWEEKLARLATYKAKHGDCHVPRGWAEDPRLAGWISNQRQYKRRLDRGEPSEGMTAERAAQLTAVGLNWDSTHTGSGICKERIWKVAQETPAVAAAAVRTGCRQPKRAPSTAPASGHRVSFEVGEAVEARWPPDADAGDIDPDLLAWYPARVVVKGPPPSASA